MLEKFKETAEFIKNIIGETPDFAIVLGSVIFAGACAFAVTFLQVTADAVFAGAVNNPANRTTTINFFTITPIRLFQVAYLLNLKLRD